MYTERIEIPENIQIDVLYNKIQVTHDETSLISSFDSSMTRVNVENGEVVLQAIKDRKKFYAMTKTFASLVRNNIRGFEKLFTRTLRVHFKHFPIRLKVQNNELIIQNFFGERHPRRAEILSNSKVSVLDDGKTVKVEGVSLPSVSQTAANIELACRIRNRDRRIFQDGIYLDKHATD